MDLGLSEKKLEEALMNCNEVSYDKYKKYLMRCFNLRLLLCT